MVGCSSSALGQNEKPGAFAHSSSKIIFIFIYECAHDLDRSSHFNADRWSTNIFGDNHSFFFFAYFCSPLLSCFLSFPTWPKAPDTTQTAAWANSSFFFLRLYLFRALLYPSKFERKVQRFPIDSLLHVQCPRYQRPPPEGTLATVPEPTWTCPRHHRHQSP